MKRLANGPARLMTVVLTAGLLTGFGPGTAWAQERPITPEDVVNVKSVGSVVISPDGSHVAYTLSHPRDEDDPVGISYSELWIIPYQGGEPVAVVEAPQSAGAPEWLSQDRLAFAAVLDDHHGQRQVYSVNTDGQDLQRHSGSQTGVRAFQFSPDGRRLAYTAVEPLAKDVQERRERGFDMEVSGEDEQHVRLHTGSAGAGAYEAEPITPGDKTVRDFEWSPDGELFAVRLTDEMGPDADFMFSCLYTIPSGGGELDHLVQTEGKLGPMAFSPDGEKLAWLGAKTYSDPLPQRLYTTSLRGGGNKEAIDHTPEDYEGTPEWLSWKDNSTLKFVSVESTRTTLNTLSLEEGAITRRMGGDLGIFRALSYDEERNRIAAAVNTRHHPNELYVGSWDDGDGNADLERRTHHNAYLDDIAFGAQETVSWYGADDKYMEGVLTLPPDYNREQSYPLAILPHGGPEGISIDGWNTRPLYPVQVLAAEGYIVFKPNYRGSGGRGTGFATANHRDLGGKEFTDVLEGVDRLVNEGMVDPDRVVISGTSYGGYFAAWAATRYSNRFAAGITFAGLSNWTSFSGTTDIPYEMADTHWDQYLFDNPGQYWDRSPVAWLDQAGTPLLVATGKADTRVHPEQSLQLYRYMKMLDIPTQLVQYPRQPHGLTERAHQLDFMRRTIDWFEEHVP